MLYLILSSLIKNVLNMANIADPDETPRFAASHLGLRYLQMLPFWNSMHKTFNHVPIITYTEFPGKLRPC